MSLSDHWRATRTASATLLLALVAGCGFALRGPAELPAAMALTRVEAPDPNAELVRQLERLLRASGVRIVGPGQTYSALLRIAHDEAGERVFSVSARGAPLEFELFHTVRFELLIDADTLVEPETLTLTRDYFFDEQDILGKTEDAAFLQTALAEDVARAIIRRVTVAGRAARTP